MSKSLSMNFVFGLVIFILEIYRTVSYDIDENQVLEEILNPQQTPSIQVRALRRELLKKVYEALDRLDNEETLQHAHYALERFNDLPDKRNLEALARAGYIKTLPEDDEDADANYKRSIANLAKNGQLPRRHDEEQKRGIESLARNGDLRLRNTQTLLDNLSDKRHIGSIVRGYELTSGKRSLSSLAKSGDLGSYKHSQYKRSPDPQEMTGSTDNHVGNTISKQSSNGLIGKQKLLLNNKAAVTKRGKRQADDYYYENDENYSPVYQNFDYDDLIQDLHDAYPEVGKRFLGSVARSGWFRPSSSTNTQYLSPDKRHIGALARSGWFPSFRHIRRFNRSGRSTDNESCRSSTTNGKTEINSNSENESLLLKQNDKYSYKIPDKLYLKRVFSHPMSRFY